MYCRLALLFLTACAARPMSKQTTLDTSDPEIGQAAAALLGYVDAQRSQCGLDGFGHISRIGRARFVAGHESTSLIIFLEVRLHKNVYHARMEKGATGWTALEVKPDPCRLAPAGFISHEQVDAINSQNLTWTAGIPADLEGREFPVDSSAARIEPVPIQRRALGVDGLPTDYDARDYLQGQTQCAAFRVRDQASCGWCGVFASSSSLSARLCLKYGRESSATNTVFSAEQAGDCLGMTCAAGNSLGDMENFYAANPAAEEYCNPYRQGSQPSCSNLCPLTNLHSSVAGSRRLVVGVENMKFEVLKNGPTAVRFNAYDDIFGYTTGIYAVSPTAVYKGGHAVMLIGWGVSAGSEYWLLQNSWGTSWGEGGFFRMRLNDPSALMEASGTEVVQPANVTTCPGVSCGPYARILKDCTCLQCPACQNGGLLDFGCKCQCPAGTTGDQCQYGFAFANVASCGAPSVGVSYNGSAGSPGVLYLCNQTCANSFYAATSVTVGSQSAWNLLLPLPPPGVYTIAFAPTAQAAQYFGTYTVLPAGCSPAALNAANVRLAAATPNYALMQSRLQDVAAAQIAAMEISLPRPIVQGSRNNTFCYFIPPYKSAAPLAVNLLDASGALKISKFIPSLPPNCVSFASFTTVVPNNYYMFQIVDTSSSEELLRTLPFWYATFALLFTFQNMPAPTDTVATVGVNWVYTNSVLTPHVNDTLKIYSGTTTDTVYLWFYLATGTTTPPAAGALPSQKGPKYFTLPRKSGTFNGVLYPAAYPTLSLAVGQTSTLKTVGVV